MQKVIAARDVDIYITFDVIGIAYKLATGASFSSNITGNTEDIGAISTDEPIATDNGGTTYDINLSLQAAEANTILNALATATSGTDNGSYTHIRQIIEGGSISIVWRKERDVPKTSDIETYTNITGVEESDTVERRGTETVKSWRFRARGKMRSSVPL